MTLRLRAYAKVNFSLDVGRLQPDGYHPYTSIAASIGVFDELFVDFAPPGTGICVTIDTGIVDSLATRGFQVVADALESSTDVQIRIGKHIPVGGGLAGGSVNAAGAMIAASRLLGPPPVPLVELGVKVGTDVPFCVTGGHARLFGRGELVEQRPPLPPFGVLLAVPPLAVSTPAVYAAFDQDPVPASPVPVPMWLTDLLPECSFRNDLAPAAYRAVPALWDWKETLERVVGRPALMTGSGAGHLCFAESPQDLSPYLPGLRAAGFAVWITTPVPVGVEVLVAV